MKTSRFVRRLLFLLLIACAWLGPVAVFAAAQRPGSPDTSFSPGASRPYSRFPVVIQPDGKIIVGYDTISSPSQTEVVIERRNPDWSVDPTFSATVSGSPPSESDGSIVSAAVLEEDGSLLLGGSIKLVNGVAVKSLARLRSDGTLDPTFKPEFDGSFGVPIRAVALLPDGRILVGGYFRSVNGLPQSSLVRLDADGLLELTFVPGFDSFGVLGIAVLTNVNKLLVATSFETPARLVRLEMDGRRDPSFKVSERTYPRRFLVLPDGKILVSEHSRADGAVRPFVRLNTDGSLDTTFRLPDQLDGQVSYGQSPWVQLPDSKLLVAGNFGFKGDIETRVHGLIRLNPDGSRDDAFDPKVPGYASTLGLQTDGKVIITGLFSDIQGQRKHTIARLHPDGSLDSSVGEPGGLGRVTPLSRLPDGRIVVRGFFKDVQSGQVSELAFLTPDGRLDRTLPTDAQAPPGFYYSLGPRDIVSESNGRLLALGRAWLNSDGTIDPEYKPFSWGTNDTHVVGVALLPDSRAFVAGRLGETTGLWRILVNGELDPSFPLVPVDLRCIPFRGLVCGGEGGTGYAEPNSATIVPLEDNRILIGGNFSKVQGFTRKSLVRLRQDGSVDPTFADIGLNSPNSSVSGSVLAIAPLANGSILIGGEFTEAGGEPRACLARLHSDGSLDTSFNARLARAHGGLPPFVFTIEVQANGKILIGGEFEHVADVPRHGIARLHPDGSLDEDFDASLIPAAEGGRRTVETMVLQSDGHILIGGNFGGAGGFLAEGVVRLFGGEAVKFLPSTARRLPSGALEFQIDAEPGRQIALEFASSLSPPIWQPLSTNTLTTSPLTVTDPDAAKFPQRFYRAVSR